MRRQTIVVISDRHCAGNKKLAWSKTGRTTYYSYNASYWWNALL